MIARSTALRGALDPDLPALLAVCKELRLTCGVSFATRLRGRPPIGLYSRPMGGVLLREFSTAREALDWLRPHRMPA